MKTLTKLLFLLAGIGLFTACEKHELFQEFEGTESVEKMAKDEATPLEAPIKAEFSVVPEAFLPDEIHDEYTTILIMVGEGKMSHLGQMTTRMIFSANMGMVGPYGYGTGVFVAANGDELHVTFDQGLIIWNEEDNNDFYLTRFNDKMIIDGGTGRFENARGHLWSNAYVHYPDPEVEGDYWHTDFFSYGKIMLCKNKGKGYAKGKAQNHGKSNATLKIH